MKLSKAWADVSTWFGRLTTYLQAEGGSLKRCDFRTLVLTIWLKFVDVHLKPGTATLKATGLENQCIFAGFGKPDTSVWV